MKKCQMYICLELGTYHNVGRYTYHNVGRYTYLNVGMQVPTLIYAS